MEIMTQKCIYDLTNAMPLRVSLEIKNNFPKDTQHCKQFYVAEKYQKQFGTILSTLRKLSTEMIKYHTFCY